MKKIHLLITITVLIVIGLNLKSQAQTTTEFVYFDNKAVSAKIAKNRRALASKLFTAMCNGKLAGYDTWHDRDIFAKAIGYEALIKSLKDTILVDSINKDSDKVRTMRAIFSFDPDKTTGFRILRSTITDKHTGAVRKVIIGIAPGSPLVKLNGDTATIHEAVCWFKYNQCRKLLANKLIGGKNWSNAIWESLFVGGKLHDW